VTYKNIFKIRLLAFYFLFFLLYREQGVQVSDTTKAS